ncbi:MAG: Hypothetical protein AJITA_00302 [Acetilactobacillus jinshanensis]
MKTFKDFIQVRSLLLELSFSNRLTKVSRILLKINYPLLTNMEKRGKVIMKNNALAQGRYYFH